MPDPSIRIASRWGSRSRRMVKLGFFEDAMTRTLARSMARAFHKTAERFEQLLGLGVSVTDLVELLGEDEQATASDMVLVLYDLFVATLDVSTAFPAIEAFGQVTDQLLANTAEARIVNEAIEAMRRTREMAVGQARVAGQPTLAEVVHPEAFGQLAQRVTVPAKLIEAWPELSRTGYIRLSMDIVNPFATTYAARHAGELAVKLSRDQVAVIRQLTTRSLTGEFSVDQLSRHLRSVVGLDPRWEAAVWKYRQRPTVTDAMADRYAARLQRARALRIARTEVLTAANNGRRAAWRAAANVGLLDPFASAVEWIAGPETVKPAGPCHLCQPMEGVRVKGLDAKFVLPNGREIAGPPAHPNCRCTTIVLPPEFDEWGNQLPFEMIPSSGPMPEWPRDRIIPTTIGEDG